MLGNLLARWLQAGEQIFDMAPISAMFASADAMEVPVGQLKLPYESFYLHWGKHLELSSPIGGRFLEGCYVSRWDDEIDFTFVSSLPADDPWDSRSLLANLAVDCEGAYAVTMQLGNGGTIGSEALEELSPSFAGEAALTRWAPHVLAATNMAANCLCYLSSTKAEVAEDYPQEAPARLVAQATSGTPNEKRRSESKLRNLGFRTIRLCGQRLAESLGIRPGSKEMPAHWRRGHWFPTHFGKGRASIRMDWRDGVVVNADKGTPAGGRIYKP